MPVVTPEKLIALQRQADGVRNICILAHVDHGKTSLSDSVIATNGIISSRLAGKIRYLDSRPDEQLRGITMESSAISLYFSMLQKSGEKGEYLINLIDSPGHVDFSSEVSTASRLCDGAVVLVDAVEGVCSQTVTVLRQTWMEKLKPLLVINKLDRLITELKMTPAEAYSHLSKLLESVNAVMGSFVLGERMEDDRNWREGLEHRVTAAASRLKDKSDEPPSLLKGLKHSEEGIDSTRTPAEYEDKDDEHIYFAPEKNNVIFSSALDGWAFTISQFAHIWEKKLGMKRSVLQKVLWGDFYYDPKTKRILGSKHLKGRNLKPMFVQLVLDNIWQVYEATTGCNNGKGDPSRIEKITNALSILLPAHVLRSREPRTILTTVFNNWLPLSTALLVSVVEHLPSPSASQAARMPELLETSPGAESISQKVKDATISFETGPDAPVIAYVSKMVAIAESELPHKKPRGGKALSAEEARELGRKKRAEIAAAQSGESNGVDSLTQALNSVSIEPHNEPPEPQVEEDKEHLIGFARLYSGTLKVGDEVYALPPKFSPAHPRASPRPKKVKIEALYLLMGRSLESLQEVPAGVIFGVEGLAGAILKNGTLSSQLEGSPNLAATSSSVSTKPIVRVAVEPENPSDLGKMIQGLKMLEQADPCAIYEVMESGEHVLAAAGELHLERCLKDLQERFAKCEISAGEPIVPYRETIVKADEMNAPRDPKLPRGTVVADTSSKQIQIRLRVRPLPESVTNFLTKNAAAVKRLYAERKAREEADKETETSDDEEKDKKVVRADDEDEDVQDSGKILSLDEFKVQLSEAFAEAKSEKDIWSDVIDKIAAFGPKRTGPNLFIDTTDHECCVRALVQDSKEQEKQNQIDASSLTPRDFADKIIHGFQLATFQGPLCNEPVQGVAVFLEVVTLDPSSSENAIAGREKLGRLTGEVIRTTREAIHTGFLDWSPRIMLAMYSCEIQASTEVLGKVYGVITRRRGRILSETMAETGSADLNLFSVLSLLPVATSFGFSDEIRKRTSGAASPQLIYSGFEAIDEDPYWVPYTEEELEDLGDTADRENVAKRFVDGVRKRKGLFVKGVASRAEGARTLKR